MKLDNTLIVCALGASMLLGANAPGQNLPRYRITDLGDLNPDNEVSSLAFGLNDQNEVTGQATTDGQAIHAFIWFPIPAYGLPQGMHDIGPGPGSSSSSRGNDIANTGHVTGRNSFSAPDPFHAFVWEPGSANNTIPSHLRMKDLGELVPELNTLCADADNPPINCDPDQPDPATVAVTSEGWAVNNILQTAGFSETIVTCPPDLENPGPGCPPFCPPLGVVFSTDSRGFFDLIANSPLDLDLKPHLTPLLATAYSLTSNNFAPFNSPLVVGRTILDTTQPEELIATPVFWDNFIPLPDCIIPTVFTDFVNPPDNRPGVPRDINELFNVVGYSCLPDDNGTEGFCGRQKALYWESVTASRVFLPAPDGLSDTTTDLRAVAINTPQPGDPDSLLRAVGWMNGSVSGTGLDAMLWEKQNGVWTGFNLNNDDTMVFRGGLWILTEAHDINNVGFGSIVGKGKRTDLPGSPNRAFLLTTLGDCPEDNIPRIENPLTGNIEVGNGVVNIDDLIGLLGDFGSCPIGQFCYADVNGNFTVNIDDLVQLLAAFGPCGDALAGPGANGLQLTDISNDFTLGFPDEQGNIIPSPLVTAAWAVQQAGPDPLTVLRLWATVDNPNATLSFAGGGVASGQGGTSEPLVLSPGRNAQFFIPNNDFSSPVDAALLNIDGGSENNWFQSRAYGSWIALGSATTGSADPTKMGDPAGLDALLTGAVNEPNTGWGVYAAVPGQGVVSDGAGGWRVLIGQFSIPQGSTFTAAVRLAGDGVDTYATITSDSITGN